MAYKHGLYSEITGSQKSKKIASNLQKSAEGRKTVGKLGSALLGKMILGKGSST